MFVDVIVKYKDEPKERVTATIGMDSNYLNNVQQDFVDYPDLEYTTRVINLLEEQER